MALLNLSMFGNISISLLDFILSDTYLSMTFIPHLQSAACDIAGRGIRQWLPHSNMSIECKLLKRFPLEKFKKCQMKRGVH